MLAFYADESGSFDLHNPTQPWVVLLAIGFDDDEWLSIDRAVNDLKATYFPRRAPHEIEIRSNDIRMAHVHPRRGNPFATLAPSELHSFGHDLYAVIDSLSFEWCASVLRKPGTIQNLSLNCPSDLFAVAYQRLLDTLDRWCRFAGSPARLFMDQRGNDLHGRHHDVIVDIHDRYRASIRRADLAVVERPYFHDSTRSNHIQLADILAYNVLRRFRCDDPRYPYFTRIEPKMCRLRDGRESPDWLVVYAPATENDESG